MNAPPSPYLAVGVEPRTEDVEELDAVGVCVVGNCETVESALLASIANAHRLDACAVFGDRDAYALAIRGLHGKWLANSAS